MTEMQTLRAPSPRYHAVAEFVLGLGYDAIPADIAEFARLLVLDLAAVAIAGTRVEAGGLARDHAVKHWAAGPGAPSARLAFDGRRASLPGATFALATQLDNLDAHDGWQPSKGHAGAALLPALLALADATPRLSGRDALTALVVGYEISYRAAAALHATTSDYHTSGAWNALGTAAIAARLIGLDAERLRHALGIAEFHAPRSQMMREIANPTMLHDGTGWGAPTGVYAALVAADGFTGAPAALIEFDDAAAVWSDLGRRWLTGEQYIKVYPTCRWAHAAIDCALALRTEHRLTAERIKRIEIRTFRYSAALWNDVPASSPVAQYALAWPVAAALARGRVTVEEILPQSFADPAIRRLVDLTEAVVDDAAEAAYPGRRIGGVVIETTDGRRLESGLREASGGPVPRPTAGEVIAKYRAFATPVIGAERTGLIEQAVLALGGPKADFKALVDLLAPPPGA
jgi:2-methylcitrate dehydratase PrpD